VITGSSSLFFLFLRLQTGMRGAFGKPTGLVARVNIGQVLMSIRTREDKVHGAVEALRRAGFKIPGRQKIHVSDFWGFTKVIIIIFIFFFISTLRKNI
jgi:ribosomal protein L16/L10AE